MSEISEMFETSRHLEVSQAAEGKISEEVGALRDTSLPHDMVNMIWPMTLMIDGKDTPLHMLMIMNTSPGPAQDIMTMNRVVTNHGDP